MATQTQLTIFKHRLDRRVLWSWGWRCEGKWVKSSRGLILSIHHFKWNHPGYWWKITDFLNNTKDTGSVGLKWWFYLVSGNITHCPKAHFLEFLNNCCAKWCSFNHTFSVSPWPVEMIILIHIWNQHILYPCYFPLILQFRPLTATLLI